ncbi:MAG: Na/Pi cotransporter family protein [Syntrophaceae bacterium]|nr:Na/Pi cotransporter family protein [Syntrophaceae bacterium]
MGVREILLFAAGITLFLFGMMRLSEEVQQYLSNVRIRQFFRLAVERPIYGLVTGIVTTVLFQSSTATSVLVVGMVSAGLMSFYRSLPIILGADVGTTVTVQLVVWKVTEISPLIVFCGGMLWFFGRLRWKKIGEGVFYFGLIFFGLELVSLATAPFKESMAVRALFQWADHPLLGLAIGVAAASLIHSSAVPITILVILAQNGVITLHHALPIVFGANIGTAITALIASLVANVNGKRAALSHFLFKLIGAVLCMMALPLFLRVLAALSPEVAQQIAFGHLLFNVFIVAFFFFFLQPFSYLVEKIIPGKVETLPIWPEFLDDRSLRDPSEALEQVRKELRRQMFLVQRMCEASIGLIPRFGEGRARDIRYIELVVDNLRRELNRYLMKISKGGLTVEQSRKLFAYSGISDDIERIGNHAIYVVGLARERHKGDIEFTRWAFAEIDEIADLINRNLGDAVSLLDGINGELISRIFAREDRVDRLVREARKRHLERYLSSICQPEAGPIFVEMLIRLERMSDHCENIAEFARDLK